MPLVETGTGVTRPAAKRQADGCIDAIGFDWITALVLPDLCYRAASGQRWSHENGEDLQTNGSVPWGDR